MPPITRALVTGASAGIGESYARQLAQGGAALVLVARRADRLEQLAGALRQEHGTEVETLPADLSTPEGVKAVAQRLGAGPAIDLLVNNAGYAARGRVGQLDPDALNHMLRVNVLALARLSHEALAAMIPRGRGALINVASGTVFMQFPGNAGYGASKNFVLGFTRNIRAETQDTGIQVQLLIPGVVATDFHAVAGNSLSNFPPERVMHPDELVAASLKALEMQEPVCIPSLPEIRDWEAYVEAERAVAANTSRDKAAARYNLHG